MGSRPTSPRAATDNMRPGASRRAWRLVPNVPQQRRSRRVAPLAATRRDDRPCRDSLPFRVRL
eukprot:7408565-Pyramimonas_sp.AAC.1